MEYEMNLITGKNRIIPKDERQYREAMTNQKKAELGDCDFDCEWHPAFGWVPEAGCPVHD